MIRDPATALLGLRLTTPQLTAHHCGRRRPAGSTVKLKSACRSLPIPSARVAGKLGLLSVLSDTVVPA